MEYINYWESLKFDKLRVMKENDGRINNLQQIKIVGNFNKKKKYNYVNLRDNVTGNKDIIIIIDNDELRIDNLEEIRNLDLKLDNFKENVHFFRKNKFKKNYSNIKDKLIRSIYKRILTIYRYAAKHGIVVKDIYVVNYDKSINNNYMIRELDKILTAQMLSYEDRINFIYDYMCDYLDQEFNEFNICDFKENKCSSRRELECHRCKNPVIYGCCYTKGRVCSNLINNRCTIKSLSCKFFTCRYLERRGIKYRPWNYLIIRLFLNYRQMMIIDGALYTSKEIVINRLLKKTKFDHLTDNVRKIAYNFNMFF